MNRRKLAMKSDSIIVATPLCEKIITRPLDKINNIINYMSITGAASH